MQLTASASSNIANDLIHQQLQSLITNQDHLNKRCNLLELKVAQLEEEKLHLQTTLNDYINSNPQLVRPTPTSPLENLAHRDISPLHGNGKNDSIGAINSLKCQLSSCKQAAVTRCTRTVSGGEQCNRLICTDHCYRLDKKGGQIKDYCPQHARDECSIM